MEINLLDRILEIDREVLDKDLIKDCRDGISGMSESISGIISSRNGPKEKVNIINNLIFNKEGFKLLKGTPGLDVNSRFVSNVMKQKTGYCLEISIIYLLIARELKLPISGVEVPMSHMFLRYLLPDNPLNIEVSYKGKTVLDDFYFKTFRLPFSESNKIKFLIPLTDDGVVGFYLNVIGHTYFRMNQNDKALYYFQREAELTPTLPKVHYSLAHVYLKLGESKKALEEFEKERKYNSDFVFIYPYLARLYLQNDDKTKTKKCIDMIIKYLQTNSEKGFISKYIQ